MSYEHAPTRLVRTRTKTGKVVATRQYIEVDPTGLGFSWNPLDIAQSIQSGADRLTANIEKGVTVLQAGQARVNAIVDSVASAGTRAGAAVQGATRGGIAAGATGDAASGLSIAALTTKPVLIVGGAILTYFLFLRHPGKRGNW